MAWRGADQVRDAVGSILAGVESTGEGPAASERPGPAASLERSEESAGGATPPVLTGGVIQGEEGNSRGKPGETRLRIGGADLRLMGVGVDYLTVTVGSTAAQDLLVQTDHDEDGYGVEGFRSSELRLCLGGECWRRWDPRSPSKRWGLDYESWRWPGECARLAWMHLPREDVRASRIDVAFDFQCGRDVRPEHLVQHVAPWLKQRGIKTGSTGEDGVYTWYIGGKQSERRIRVYRRDLRDGSGVLVEMGAVLRVELQLTDDHADAMLQVLSRGGTQVGWAAAAAHIREMTGLEVQTCGEVPTLPTVEDADQEAQLWQFIEQHGERMDAWARMGVDVLRLAREFSQTRSRMTKWRACKRLERWACVDWEQVVGRIRRRIVDLVRAPADVAA